MGAWAFQEVLNVGIQIVLIVFGGWCFARFRLLSGEAFMGQVNVLLLRVAFPTLNIYLLGIKVDLRDADAWRSLGGYMLWVTLVEFGILLYVWLCRGRTIGDAGLLNLVLTANNTVIVGLPVMEATFPQVGGRLSLLTAFVLFLQVIPYSITAFEVEKWMLEDHRRRAAAAATVSEPPSTPDRELSGRWVAEPPPSAGYAGAAAAADCNGGGGAGGWPKPRASSDVTAGEGGLNGGRPRRQESLGRSSAGSSGSGGGGGDGRGPPYVRSRLGRRRVGSGVVVGAEPRGWAPATPADSPYGSRDVSTRPPRSPPLAAAEADAAAVAAVGAAESSPPISREATLRLRQEVTVYGIFDSVAAGPGPSSAGHAGLDTSGGGGGGDAEGAWTQRPNSAAATQAAAETGAKAAAAARATCCAPAAPTPFIAPTPTTEPTPGSVALACLDRATSAPCPNGGFVGSDGGGGWFGKDASCPAVELPSAAPSSPSTTSTVRAGLPDGGCSAAAAAAAPAAAPAASGCTFAFRPPPPHAATDPADAVAAAAVASSLQPPPTTCGAGAAAAPPSSPAPSAAAPPCAAGKTRPTTTGGGGGGWRVRGGAHRRLPRGRASADYCPPTATARSGDAAAAAASRPTGRQDPRAGDGGDPFDAGLIQRRSLPAHWPPASIESSPLPVVVAVPPPPQPSPPLSRRLLNPMAVACPDLPVPQAIGLARAPTSALTDGRSSYNGGGGYGTANRSTAHYDTLIIGGDVNDFSNGFVTDCDASNRPSGPGRRRTAGGSAVAVSVGAATDAAAATVAAAGEQAAAAGEQAAVAAPPLSLEFTDRALARAAAGSMTRRHGGLIPAVGRWLRMRLAQYSRAWSITWVILKNPLLWSLLVGLVINLSGLRSLLWPASAHYRPELGWVAGALAWTSGITVPVSLFSNGVWLYGKTFGRATMVQAGWLMAMKFVVLGPLQLACAAACGLDAEAAMSLLLLALCPVASTSFVIASQYGHGAELVTAMTLLGIGLLVPVVLAALALPKAIGLYDYSVAALSGSS